MLAQGPCLLAFGARSVDLGSRSKSLGPWFSLVAKGLGPGIKDYLLRSLVKVKMVDSLPVFRMLDLDFSLLVLVSQTSL